MKQKHKSSLSRKDKEKRRLKAAKMFAHGIGQAEIAKKFKVTPTAVNQWHKLWDKGGSEALKSIGSPGPESELTPEKSKKFKKAILKGPRSYGYETDLWTLPRLKAVMKNQFFGSLDLAYRSRVGLHPAKTPGQSQAEKRKGYQRVENQDLARLKKKWAKKKAFYLAFEDESGLSEKPVVRRTWALKGKTPTIHSSGSWKSLPMTGMIKFTPDGNNPQLFFQIKPGSMDRYDFLKLLKNVKTEMKGKKLLLIWDRLPVHRSKIVASYIKSQKSWLRVEYYPGYAPELSPVEFMWSAMKGKDLAHIPPKGLKHLKRLVRKSVRRIKSDKQLLKGFLKKAFVLS